jgi:hypothetical protein
MSLLGQVLCQRIVTGPADLAIDGKPSAAAPAVATAAPVRNLRRDTHVFFASVPGSFFVMLISLPVVVLWICGSWMQTSGQPFPTPNPVRRFPPMLLWLLPPPFRQPGKTHSGIRTPWEE